jgi:hypothetical protein
LSFGRRFLPGFVLSFRCIKNAEKSSNIHSDFSETQSINEIDELWSAVFKPKFLPRVSRFFNGIMFKYWR